MKQYLLHKTKGWVGVADIPEWLDFDSSPPRSFDINWLNRQNWNYPCSTSVVVPITKEVADIILGV